MLSKMKLSTPSSDSITLFQSMTHTHTHTYTHRDTQNPDSPINRYSIPETVNYRPRLNRILSLNKIQYSQALSTQRTKLSIYLKGVVDTSLPFVLVLLSACF